MEKENHEACELINSVENKREIIIISAEPSGISKAIKEILKMENLEIKIVDSSEIIYEQRPNIDDLFKTMESMPEVTEKLNKDWHQAWKKKNQTHPAFKRYKKK